MFTSLQDDLIRAEGGRGGALRCAGRGSREGYFSGCVLKSLRGESVDFAVVGANLPPRHAPFGAEYGRGSRRGKRSWACPDDLEKIYDWVKHGGELKQVDRWRERAGVKVRPPENERPDEKPEQGSLSWEEYAKKLSEDLKAKTAQGHQQDHDRER